MQRNLEIDVRQFKSEFWDFSRRVITGENK